MPLKDTPFSKGSKKRAGRLLSGYLRIIAQEETEFIKSGNGEDDRMASKAEQLARQMWKMALGYEEIIEDSDGNKKTVKHPPDRSMVALLYDRVEGKATPSDEGEKDPVTIADKVTEQGVSRINQITKDLHDKR